MNALRSTVDFQLSDVGFLAKAGMTAAICSVSFLTADSTGQRNTF
jgi:hypothetical protein